MQALLLRLWDLENCLYDTTLIQIVGKNKPSAERGLIFLIPNLIPLKTHD